MSKKIYVKAADYVSVDADYDLIEKGAIATNGRTIKFLRSHDKGVVLGVVTRLDERTDGLYAEIELADEEQVPQVKQAMYEMQNGLLEKMSIGFKYTDLEYDENQECFVVKGLDLYEVSMVAIPSNNNTGYIKEISEDSSDIGPAVQTLINNLNNF